MNREPARIITDEEVAAFRRDGVVHLKGLFDADWVTEMETAFDHAISHLGPSGMNMVPPGQQGAYYMDLGLWMRHEFFRKLALESPAVGAAARLMGSDKIWLYDDQLFVKEPGTSAPTIFHQDAGYFRCHGFQICGMWLTADRVDRASGALGFVRGSHLWGKVFKPRAFTAASAALYAKARAGEDMPAPPIIEDEIDKYDIVYFDYEPGDCTFHHVRTLHGASGNASATRRRRAISVRYCGDDAVYAARPYAPAQPHIDVDLEEGAPIGCAVHPQVWPRA